MKETQNYGIRRRSLLGGFFSDFQRLDAIYKFLDEIVSQNPKIASIITTGKSFEKREIRLIRIGVNHSSKTTPIIYIDGGIHAREWAAVSTACYIIDQLMKEYNAGQQTVKNFLTKYNFYITPVVNPDGYEYTHTNVFHIKTNLKSKALQDFYCYYCKSRSSIMLHKWINGHILLNI